MDKKLKKLHQGKTVQFTHAELARLPHDIFKTMNAGKIIRAHKSGKGCRLQLEDGYEQEALGGKLHIGRAFKKIGKQVNNAVNNAVNKVEKAVPNQREMKQFGRRLERGIDKGLTYGHKALAMANDLGLAQVPGVGAISQMVETGLGQADKMVDQAQEMRKNARNAINAARSTMANPYVHNGAGITTGRGISTGRTGGLLNRDTAQSHRVKYGGKVYSDGNALLARYDTQMAHPLKISTLGNVV